MLEKSLDESGYELPATSGKLASSERATVVQALLVFLVRQHSARSSSRSRVATSTAEASVSPQFSQGVTPGAGSDRRQRVAIVRGISLRPFRND